MTINKTVARANGVVVSGAASGEKRRDAIRHATTHGSVNLIDLPASPRSSRRVTGRFYRFLALIFGLCTMTAQAEEYRYHYESLTDVPLPAGYRNFRIATIDDDGRVYGTVWANDSVLVEDDYIADYEEGVIRILQRGGLDLGQSQSLVNKRGTLGGYVRDPDIITFSTQAALFSKKKVELITKLPGATVENVIAVNDSGTALVWSEVSTQDTFYNRNKYRLYKNGKTTFQYQIPIGNDCPRCWGVNNQGVVAGQTFDPDLGADRGIRFQPPKYKPQILDPLLGDTDSAALGINNRGYVLGVSINDPYGKNGNPTYSIGLWDRNGDFETYSIDTQFFSPLFNDRNLVVLRKDDVGGYGTYLAPEPGMRLNIEDLIDNPNEIDASLISVLDINNRGDMIGTGEFDDTTEVMQKYILKRIVPDHHDRHDRNDHHDRHDRNDHHDRHDRNDQHERQDRHDRQDRH